MSDVFCISVSKAIGRAVAKYHKTVALYKQLDACQLIMEILTKNRIVLFSHTNCPAAKRAKKMLKNILSEGTSLFVVEVDDNCMEKEIRDVLERLTGSRNVPQIFVDTVYIGGEVEVDFVSRNQIQDKLVQKALPASSD
eukprot:TRINITY_DN15989_c0_g1_i4.p1 TRINITY_DN15989_c0_g1~~TRINITY_DN15989_c0_g1_i4.p1  ORF type:complete len:139 (-),score=9.15 TRINITY_DN15989_c0_g1_i4:174-590(-)